MANTFDKKSVVAGVTTTVLYTVPALTTAVVLGFMLTNKGTSQITASADIDGLNVIGVDTIIPVGSALSALDGKMVLTAGEVLSVVSDTASALDCRLSIMEMT